MSKVDDQHGGTADGKVFPAKAPEGSPEFGICQRDYEVYKGAVPGSAQWEPLSPDPETP